MLLNCVGEDSWEFLGLPVNPKGNQSWIFIGRTDAEAETPIRCLPDVKNWLIGKDPDSGRDWGQEEKGTTEDEMAGWPHRLNGREFEWTLGVGKGQGGLACCSSWGRKDLDMTEWLNWTEWYYRTPGWLKRRMWNPGYREPIVVLCWFSTEQKLVPQTSVLFTLTV